MIAHQAAEMVPRDVTAPVNVATSITAAGLAPTKGDGVAEIRRPSASVFGSTVWPDGRDDVGGLPLAARHVLARQDVTRD
jgi:hypothetical protein